MSHITEGQLRAYHDGALTEEEFQHVRAHLATCARCARESVSAKERGEAVETVLASMESHSTRAPVSPQIARYRFNSFVEERKETSMLRKIFAPRRRPVWAAIAAVLVVAIAFSFAPVRSFASEVLALFRVQKVQFIGVAPSQIPDEQALHAALEKLEIVMEDQMTLEIDGESRVIDEATARSLAVFPVRLPTALDDVPEITLEPGVHAEMTVDLPRIRALLNELGYGDTNLPDSLDGAEVTVDFSPMVVASYGECQTAPVPASGAPQPVPATMDCTLLVQTRSPDISAPPVLDLDQLGSAYLQLLGFNAEEAAELSQRMDWTTTFLIPVPEYSDLQHQDVIVDGVPGTLITPAYPRRDEPQYLLTWLKDGMVYGLLGSGTTEEGLAIANSLQ